MVYKLLFLLGFMVPYNVTYNLQQIECPRWGPGTDEILPMNVTPLSSTRTSEHNALLLSSSKGKRAGVCS